MAKTSMLNLRMDAEEFEALAKEAEIFHMSFSDYVREIIRSRALLRKQMFDVAKARLQAFEEIMKTERTDGQ